MRPDMAKVIVERPRYGSRDRSRKKGYRKYVGRMSLDALPRREPMLGRWRGHGRSLNEHLGPMRRFLRSQVGRPWNKVHQDLCEHVSFDNAVQKHVLAHIYQYVHKHVELEGDTIWTMDDYRRQLWPGAMYVCPRSGLLKLVPEPRRQPIVCHVQVTPGVQMQRRGDTWWEVQLREYLPFHDQWDVWFACLADQIPPAKRHAMYNDQLVAISMRPLTRHEIRNFYKRLRTAVVPRQSTPTWRTFCS